LQIPADQVEITSNSGVSSAIRQAAHEANDWLLRQKITAWSGCNVELRYFLLLSSESTQRETPPESFKVTHAQLPNAFARMIVKIPSAGTPRHTVTATMGPATKGFTLGVSGRHFEYVFGSSESTMTIQGPSHGSCAYLIYDVVCTDTANLRLLTDRRAAAHAILRMCVPFWEEDADCKKLVVSLQRDQEGAWDEKDQFGMSDMQHGRNARIVDMLAGCEDLDVSFAGTRQ
jgi:hypothetical protein